VRLYETRNGKPNQAEMDQSKHNEGNGTSGMPVTFVQSLRNGGDDDDDDDDDDSASYNSSNALPDCQKRGAFIDSSRPPRPASVDRCENPKIEDSHPLDKSLHSFRWPPQNNLTFPPTPVVGSACWPRQSLGL
jgi:hypothetical protein